MFSSQIKVQFSNNIGQDLKCLKTHQYVQIVGEHHIYYIEGY